MSFDQLVESGRVERNVPTHSWTTYKRGGPAAFVFEAMSVGDLEAITPLEIPVLVLGKGSNLVIADAGFDGLVLRLGGDFNAIVVDEAGVVTAGGAVALPVLARTVVKQGRGGLEWMVGVPGSVGGAVRMNAGCFGSDTASSLASAHILNLRSGASRDVGPSELEMRYRHSAVQDADLVTHATFDTEPIDRAASEATMREITRWRRDHQPGGTFNAGSVFKNPPGDYAGRIIDELGLKGTAVGGVSISTKHANFFVADEQATSQDIFDLVKLVRDTVEKRTGVALEPEIRFVGFEPS